MRRLFGRQKDRPLERMFETRSDAWAAVGLEDQVSTRHVHSARRRLVFEIPLLIACIVAKDQLIHKHTPPELVRTVVTIAAVGVVIVLGWLISRDLSRIAPAFFKRMDPATAGTVEFLIRFLTVAAAVLGALSVAGVETRALAVGGAFTAVVLGLAAQQTLGNLIAGMVLLSARPFRLGERVRLQAGAVGGTTEGIVSSLGLLYTTLSRGEDRIMIPNNVVLAAVIVPIREPEPVDVKVRLGTGVRITEVQRLLDANVTTPTRSPPNVMLEEIEDDTVGVRVRAIPDRHDDGARLADEIIAVLSGVTGEHRLPD